MDAAEYNAVFNLPFTEASSFFQKKLSIPTAAWNDLWQGQHALGFMSAGAYKAELLADLRGAVQKSIDGNMSLKEFQGKFDDIVQTHGWNYNGGRNWRSELIWDTNITTSYQAGRWEQFQVAGTEYLRYVHADGVQHPRPLHVSWNGITLAIGDPWIDTHYTPNGWKCHCRWCRADRAEWATAKAAGHGTAPNNGTYEWTDKKSGQVHTIPNGIDPGWDYNVGKSAGKSFRVLGEKFDTLPNDISRAWMKEHAAGPAFARFIEGKIPGEFPVAVLQTAVQSARKLDTQTIWLSQETLQGFSADLTIDDYRLLPALIDNDAAVAKQYRATLTGNKLTKFQKVKS